METLEEKIQRFLAVSTGYGYGAGSGSGYGYGYGSGYGSGYGYGYGSGYGSGYGAGSGSGYGYGSGYGSGYGDGSGSGSGSGPGYGYGDGLKEYNGRKVYCIDGVPSLIYSVHVNYAKGASIGGDLVLSPCYIARHGDYFAHGETLHAAVTAAIEKFSENRPLKERINDFMKTHPLGQKASFGDLFRWHHILTGSCEFGRREFCRERGITEADSFTPEEFIDLTKNAYGSSEIRQLAEAYGLTSTN